MIKIHKITESDDNLITRWEMAGALDEIPDEEKATIAHLLHDAALYLTADDVEEKISILFIKTIRRIYSLNNKCVAIKFKVLELMLKSALYWGWKDHPKPKISVWNKVWNKVKAFFIKISILNLISPSEEISIGKIVTKSDREFLIEQKIGDDAIEQVSKEYVEKFCMHGNAMSVHDYDCGKLCEHGKGMTDYCLPCNRINGTE